MIPLLHAQTRKQVASFTANPSHALLLVGPHGIGKTFLATAVIADILGLSSDTVHQHPYFLHVQPGSSSISIDTIRELQKFLQLKTLGSERPIRRAIIVEHAETLTTEAQNAFLKLLEEPPADTIMVLTANNQRALLPTILSRAQQIAVQVPAEADVKAHFASHADAASLTQAFFLSGGLPGLMHALLSGDTAHPLTEGVAQAKQVLQKNLFERLAMVESLAKQKESAAHTLDALLLIAQVSISQATTKGDAAKIKQWHHILKVTHAAQQALLVSANTKLTLTNLMLNLK
jgi:DNA polymerase-3 subunit delta'